MTTRTLLRTCLAVALLAALAGCMTERSPLDKTDPQSLDKNLFDGEFLYKQTIVDMPYNFDEAFIGQTNEAKIVRFEITESWLYVYNVHSFIDYTNTSGEQAQDRLPVLAYPIKDHFDIVPAENTTTGEDLPVLTPNHDKPWWERRYFTIDMSQSYMTNFDMDWLLWVSEWDNPFYREPAAGYYNLEFYNRQGGVIAPKEYAWAVERGGEQQEIDIISFKSDELLSPTHDWNWWLIRTMNDVREFIQMETSKLTYRHFFTRFDREMVAKNFFERMDYQDRLFRHFGYFYSEQRGYDHQYGYRDKDVHYWANYFNAMAKTTGAALKAVYPKLSMVDDNEHYFHVKPVEYYLSPRFPNDMILAACDIGADYNYAFNKALDAYLHQGRPDTFPTQDALGMRINYLAKEPESWDLPAATDWNGALAATPAEWQAEYAKCFNAISDPRDLLAEGNLNGYEELLASQKVPLYVIKRNALVPYDAVREGNDPDGNPNSIAWDELAPKYRTLLSIEPPSRDVAYACELTPEHACRTTDDGYKVPRFKATLGDSRYSMIYWVDKPTEYGILGVAQWTANPETGETFSGVAHIAGSVLEWATRRYLDFYEVLDGTLTPEEIAEAGMLQSPGQVIEPRGLSLLDSGRQRLVRAADKALPYYEVKKFLQTKKAGGYARPLPVTDERLDQMRDYIQRMHDNQRPLAGRLDLSAIKGTKWEKAMTPQGLVEFYSPRATDTTEELLEIASPLNWATIDGMRDILNNGRKITRNCYFEASWLDTATLKFLEEQHAAGNSLEQAFQDLRKITFKAVAEHEVGHTIGLRHNFMSHADEQNYLDPYHEHKTAWQAAMDTYRQQNPEATGRELFDYGKTISTKKDFYAYASVMDYQDEAFAHAWGLGKYDLAAVKFAYGKTYERYQLVENEDKTTTKVRYNMAYLDDNGYIKTEPRKKFVEKVAGSGIWSEVEDPKLDANGRPIKDENGRNVVPVMDVMENAGVNHMYLFCSDEKIWDDPRCQVWAQGSTGAEMVRNKINSLEKYYYYRMFRRGNPKYKEAYWIAKFRSYYPLALWALDFNYNVFYKEGWLDVLFSGTDAANQYAAAMRGQEYYQKNGQTVPLPQFGPGDYAIAAMESYNYMLMDVLYRPDVEWYLKDNWAECDPMSDPDCTVFWNKNPYVISGPDLSLITNDFFFTDSVNGRYHKSRYDVQDDPDIYYEKFERSGFTIEKDIVTLMLTNSGWPNDKYARESMANDFKQFADGYENANLQLMRDMTNEDAMWSFSHYCADQDENSKWHVVRKDVPINALALYNARPSFDDTVDPIVPPKHWCGNLAPMHASWIYFDKMFPLLWAMYDMANIMADNTVSQYFTTEVIPDSHHADYTPVRADQVEFLNQKGGLWYRATMVPGKPSPVYDLVKRAKALKDQGVSSGDELMNTRDLQVMESTLILLNDYAQFWTSTTGLFFGN